MTARSSLGQKATETSKKLRATLRQAWNRTQPSAPVRRGAAWGIILITAVFLAFAGFFETPGLPGVLDYLSGSLFFLGTGALIGLFAFFILSLLKILPRFINQAGLSALAVLIAVFLILQSLNSFTLKMILMISLTGAFLGGGLAALSRRDFKFEPGIKKIGVFSAIIIPIAVLSFMVIWTLDPGDTSHLIEPAEPTADIPPLPAPNPAQPGSFEVNYLTYGSGTDQRRPEYGEKVNLTSFSVNGDPFLKGNSGFKMKIRNWYWGFKPDSLPLNGRVWYPEGAGPFPLILIVHGNHKMEEYSDPGYAYLGEHFASRGYIFVSVDENFFNGGFLSSLSRENDARAWILLQHLSLWRQWNQSADHPFYQKADMDNLGLIGHSRGGEAAAIAGGFNRLSYYPDDASVAFDFNFNIKSIAAIAPSDQQYKPAGLPNPLEDINYLVIQGGHDADVSLFLGARQFSRTAFTGNHYGFKAGIYIYRSNHGQFNTVWGDMDYGLPSGLLLNRVSLLSGEQQRKIGIIYLTAFFDSTLKGNPAYLPMFRDHRRIQDWLPPDIYISRFQDSTFSPICEFGEDIDLTTASLSGAAIQGTNLALWREGEMEFRQGGTKQNSAVFLGWRGPASQRQGENAPVYSILLPPFSQSGLTLDSYLVFSVCEADESLPESDDSPEEAADSIDSEINPSEKNPDVLSFHIELIDSSGAIVRRKVESYMPVPPRISSRFTKMGDESGSYGSDYEPTLQTVHIPLSEFSGDKNGFNAAELRTIRFVFDRGKEGILILDDIGFSRSSKEQSPAKSVY